MSFKEMVCNKLQTKVYSSRFRTST